MKTVPPDNQNFHGLELVPPNSMQVLIKKPGTGVSEGSGEGKLIRRQTTGTLSARDLVIGIELNTDKS